MSNQALIPAPPDRPAAGAEPGGASLEQLTVSVVRLRMWLIALTLAFALLTLGACSPLALLFVGATFMDDGSPAPAASSVEDVRRQVGDAYGRRLTDLEVRVVSLSYGDAPFPFSLVEGNEKCVYLEAHLNDPDIVIADIVGSSADLVSSGLLPTRGPLSERLTDERFARLAAAFRARTESPLGRVFRYREQPSMDTESLPDEVTVGGATYATEEMWSAVVGRSSVGDRIDLSDSGDTRDSLVFHEDPGTGEFTYVGTERVEDVFTSDLMFD